MILLASRVLKHFCFFAAGLLALLVLSVPAAAGYASADSVPDNGRESLFPQISRPLGDKSHFTWGADIGASIDIDVEDMSTFNANLYFGYKNSLIKFAGVGAGVHRSFGNGNNFIPIYAMFRSSFRKKPSLLFLDFRGGYSFNSIASGGAHGGFYGALGLGFNLSKSAKCSTHIVLSYACFVMDENKYRPSEETFTGSYINYAELKFGVSF